MFNDAITLRLFNDLINHGGRMSSKRISSPMNFKTMAVPDVPRGRSGKHKQIVSRIVSDLEQVQEGVALRFLWMIWPRARRRCVRP